MKQCKEKTELSLNTERKEKKLLPKDTIFCENIFKNKKWNKDVWTTDGKYG